MRKAGFVALVLALSIGSAAPAGAAPALTGPGSFAAGWLTPVVVITEGEGITYLNADAAPHNFISDGVFLTKRQAKKVEWCSAYEKGLCPLFWSDTIGAGESTEVRGLEALKTGEQYPFFCSLHPNMKGTLIVR